jgi:hypothetical protein
LRDCRRRGDRERRRFLGIRLSQLLNAAERTVLLALRPACAAASSDGSRAGGRCLSRARRLGRQGCGATVPSPIGQLQFGIGVEFSESEAGMRPGEAAWAKAVVNGLAALSAEERVALDAEIAGARCSC